MVSYKRSYKNIFPWGISSVGRAPALQAGGHEFDSRILHLAVKTAENLIRYSSLAQSVEHSAVNRSVVGSSPTGGAYKASCYIRNVRFFSLKSVNRLMEFRVNFKRRNGRTYFGRLNQKVDTHGRNW